MIKVGDVVKVTDSVRGHSIYTQWFERWKPNLKYEWVVHYHYNARATCLNIKDLYCVLFVDTAENLALIREEGRSDYKVFLVDIENLTEPSRRMTKKQIERELGYEIEIIEEGEEQ